MIKVKLSLWRRSLRQVPLLLQVPLLTLLGPLIFFLRRIDSYLLMSDVKARLLSEYHLRWLRLYILSPELVLRLWRLAMSINHHDGCFDILLGCFRASVTDLCTSVGGYRPTL